MKPCRPFLMEAVCSLYFRLTALFRFSAIIVGCLLAADVFGAAKNWEGDVSSDWNDPNNWQGNVFPGASNDATINPANYTHAPVISANSTHTFKKLTVSGGGVLTIQADLSVSDVITVTGANSRIVHSAGAVSISSGNKNIIITTGGTYNLSGGSLSCTGVLTITDATFNLSGTGSVTPGTSLTLTASTANTAFNMTAGTATIPAISYAAATNALSATISVSGGTFTNSGATTFGNSEDDLTPFNVSGGTVTLTGAVAEAGGAWGGNVTFNVSDSGSLIFQNALTMDGTDVFTQTGGTITFQGGNRTWTNAGTFTSTGGTVVFNDATATVITGAGSWDFNNVTINSGKTLTATNPTNINVAGNWTNSGGTFNEGTKRVTFNGTSDQTITGAETFYDLTVNKSSGKIILASNVTASNSLTMTAGNIDANGNKMILGTSTSNIGTLNYTAGAIIGKFERWINTTTGTARVFPVGTASATRSASVTFTNITAGSLIAEFIATNPGSSGLPLTESSLNITDQFTEGYWDFTAANSLASTNYRVDLTGTGFTSYGLTSSVRVLQRTDSGSAWALQGTHVALSGSTAARTGLSGISTAQFGFGKVSCSGQSATVTQSVTTDVWQGSTDNEIIRIAVNSSAATCADYITGFTFSTTGTPGCSAASTDISNAKVYYTGTSSTFATTTLFGSLGSAPNGSFTINGSQAITNNTVYFWLVYDIAGTAAVNNKVDGQLVSFVMNGTTQTAITTPDPAGSRTIKGQRYAVANGNWTATSTWSYTDGGPAGASAPVAGTTVYIKSGRTVTVNSSGAAAGAINITAGAADAKLDITTGGNLTCSSISMTTTNKKPLLTVQQTGSLTVNGNVSIDFTNGTVNTTGVQVLNSATVTINGNLTLTNPAAKWYEIALKNTSITTVTGNVTLSGNAADRAWLSMGGTARLNVKGSLGIAPGKYGEIYNIDGLHTSIINFNGTTAQTLEMNTSAANSSMWLYSTVWISNPAGVTLNGSVVDNITRNSIRKSIVVKSGTFKTGGYSITLDDVASSLFQVDDGATFYTTTTDAYGGMPAFGANTGLGKITLASGSTVTFAASGNQTIPILSGVDGSGYGNVTVAGSGTKTLGRPHHADFSGTGAWDVNGNLTINNNVKLDVSASNYNITVGGNWTDQNTVAQNGFNQRSGTVTFDGNATQTITPTAALSFYNLTVNKSGGTLNISTSDITVSNALTMTLGNINCGSRILTLGTGTGSIGTLNYTAGTIIGKFKRWLSGTGTDRVFPVGTSTYYRPVTLRFNQLTAGTMEVEFVASAPSNGGLPLTENSVTVGASNICTEGYWRCTAANSLASTNYNITLGINGFTSKVISSNTRVIKRANSGSNWTLDGTHVATTSTTAGRTGCSGFSEFAIATVNCTPSVTATATVDAHACNNSGGAVSLSLTNAQAPVSYTWSNGATTQNISNLSAGAYSVTVVDANNCSASTSANVGVTAASMTVTHSTSEETPNGAIDLTVGGGTAPYTYLWNDPGTNITTQDRTGLQEGWYEVTITDVSGCKTVKSALVARMDTIKAGSFIVDMGVLPQTIGNSLKPFGFINDMIRNQHIPVEWVINPDKTLYGADFELGGKEYKGGPFIVKYEYIDNVIINRINYWKSRGVVGDFTTEDMVVPVYASITGFSNLGIDQENENLVIPYFNNAEIPTNVYYVGLPSALGSCDNAYVLPHADPTWANHHYLKTFVQDGGYVWAGCHAVSVLEGIYQPGNTSNRMNFLTETGLQCYGSGKCSSLITETHAGTPSTPYTYDNTLGAHPLMQIMGDLTPSTENGSEKWYIPLSTGAWNTGVYRAIKTADGSTGKEGVKLAFGYGFDDKDNGLVMYEAGHTAHGKGTTASQVAAQRTFFNFILHSGISKRLVASVTAPSAMAEGTGATVSVNITSGGAPFTYHWTTNVQGSFSNPNAASTTFNLSKGNGRPYARITVAVTDACGRVFYETKTITVLYAAGPVVSWYGGYNISCNGGHDGTIQVVGMGGTPPYTYEWGHGETTAYIENLSAGEYTVTITDAMMIQVFDTIELTEPPTYVNVDSIIFNGTILCYGDTTGSLDMTVSGGTLPYTILWSNGETTEDITGITTGTYDVTVTDYNGCYAVTTPPLSIGPDSLTITAATSNVTTCGGSDGSISLSVTGGTGPYTYSWTTGATASSIAGISVGNYKATVTDANNCSDTTSTITITQPTAQTLSSTPSDVLCSGAATGGINLTVTGGAAPFSYSWSNGATTEDLSNVTAGTYSVTVTDNNSCTATHSRTISTITSALTASSTTVNITPCYGDSNGSIDLTPGGGTPDYTYSWSDGHTTQDISGKTAGTYTVTITDANGCTLTHSKTLTQPSQISASASVTNITTCYGDNSGSVTISVSGGTAPYGLYDDEGFVTGVPSTLSNLPAFTGTFWVKDANNCVSGTFDITVTEPSEITSTLTINDVTTHGGSNGSISQSVSGGTGSKTYSWSNGATTRDISNLTAGTYTVTITDANNCTITKSATVTEPGICPCTWLGTTNNSWHEETNWDCGFVPSDTCDVIIPASTPAPCEILNNAECRNLTIQPTASLNVIGTNQLDIYGNLTNNGNFIRNNSVVKFLGSAEQHIYGTKQTNFWNLHIVNSSATGVRLHKSIGVYADMRLLDGYVFTGTDTVKVETDNQGSLLVFNANSFIVGKVRRKINNIGQHGYEFPVGDDGTPSRFFRAYIRTNNLQGTSYLTVWFSQISNHSNTELQEAFLSPPADIANYYPDTIPKVNIINGDTTTTLLTPNSGYTSGSYANNHYNIKEAVEEDGVQYSFLAPEGIWHFEPNRQPTGGFYDMIIYTTNLSGLSDNNFGVLKRPTGTNGRYWCHGSGKMNPFNGPGRKLSDGYAMRMMLTTFSDGGGGGGGGGGLPIELLYFKARLVGNKVELFWETATEINNDYFTVEKSDGKVFRQIAIVPGAGNSSTPKSYTSTDYDPFTGTSYYRLKQTDYDGKFAYSEIVSITYNPDVIADEDNELTIFPNPTGGQFTVILKKPSEKVVLYMFDSKGKLVFTETYKAREEDYMYTVQLDGLLDGVYYLKADAGNKTIYTKKLLLFGEQK